MVEQQFRKLQVVGSIPTVGSTAYAYGFAFAHSLWFKDRPGMTMTLVGSAITVLDAVNARLAPSLTSSVNLTRWSKRFERPVADC